jgi:hypothetical protein
MAVGIIHNVDYRAHTESLLKSLSILPCPLPTDYFKLQFVYLFSFSRLPTSFNNNRVKNSDSIGEINNETILYHLLSEFYCYAPSGVLPKLRNEFANLCKSLVVKSCLSNNF